MVSISTLLSIILMLYIMQYFIQIISQVLSQFYPSTNIILQDNFDDGVLNTDIWEVISNDPSGSSSEVNGVLRITTSGGYHQGIVTKNKYDLSNTELSVKFIKNENARQTLQIAIEKLTDGTEPAECYYISHDRVDGVFEIRRKLWGEISEQIASRSLPTLPKTIKVRIEGDTIEFYLDDELIHSESFALSTKELYIWLFVAGSTPEEYHGDSEYDDFILQKIS